MTSRALIVIDVQNEYVTGNLRIQHPPVEQALERIAAAMDLAHARGIPVIVAQQISPPDAPLFAKGSPGGELHPAIAARPRDHLVGKTWPSAFSETDLGAWLAEHGIDTLTVSGFMTHNCDDTTVKHAFDAGLNVEFLVDAAGSVPYENRAGFASAEEIHRVFAVVQQSRFAAVLTVEEWRHCLDNDLTPERDTIHASHQRALASARAGSRA